LASLPSAPLPAVFARKLRMRLHRRNYSCGSAALSASSASSHCSVSMKISG
jgi:hypothetical protein